MAFGASGQRLVLASRHGLRSFSLPGGELLRWAAHDRSAVRATISSTGQVIAALGHDPLRIIAFDPASGRRATEGKLSMTLGRRPLCLAHAPEQPVVAVGYDNGRVAITQRGDGARLSFYASRDQRVLALAFCDGALASLSADGLRLWDYEPAARSLDPIRPRWTIKAASLGEIRRGAIACPTGGLIAAAFDGYATAGKSGDRPPRALLVEGQTGRRRRTFFDPTLIPRPVAGCSTGLPVTHRPRW